MVEAPYSWPGAVLLIIGMLICQQFILALPFKHNTQASVKSPKKVDLKGYISTLRMPGAPFMMLTACLLSGAILSGVYIEVANIAVEVGLSYTQSATLVAISSIFGIIMRPAWGIVTRWVDTTTCQVIYCSVCFACQITFLVAESYLMFVVALFLFAIVMAGHNGLKVVIWIKVVTFQEAVAKHSSQRKNAGNLYYLNCAAP